LEKENQNSNFIKINDVSDKAIKNEINEIDAVDFRTKAKKTLDRKRLNLQVSDNDNLIKEQIKEPELFVKDLIKPIELNKRIDSIERQLISLAQVVVSFESFYKKQKSKLEFKSQFSAKIYEDVMKMAKENDDFLKEINKLKISIDNAGTNETTIYNEAVKFYHTSFGFFQKMHGAIIMFASYVQADADEMLDQEVDDKDLIQGG